MKIRVTLADQPLRFIRRQPPGSRRALRQMLQAVETGKAFPEPLTAELDGFYKLKVSSYRMILQAESAESGPRFHVAFAERRDAVYVLFTEIMGLE
jgi:mRNA-degrading endonuclease RelE of RelBE toxin-antitoxin system